MKVHFAASNHNLTDHIEDYHAIIATVKSDGHTLVREWLDEDIHRQENRQAYSPQEYRTIWQDVKHSIMQADLVIMEASENTYSIGYQSAFALNNKKPVLVMTTNNQVSKTIIAGEDNPLLSIAQYTPDSLQEVVGRFLQKFSAGKQDMRFNMLLDRETQVYLELESYQTGKTKARIIRDMLKREMRHKSGL